MESAFAGPRVVHASGSAEARTWYEISAVLPLEYEKKLYTDENETRYSLLICGNRINFYTRSGILGLKCDNIITERQLGFGELFQLPVTLICERSEKYETQSAYYSATQAEQVLGTVLYDALMQKIGEGGIIVSAQFSVRESDGFAVAVLRAECRQNIAQEIPLTPPLLPVP
jgi:Putative stage IV sporulation protein YqfD.